MLEMCAALGARCCWPARRPRRHASDDRDAIARDLRKLAMLALPLGIRVAYEGLSWGRTINEFTAAWDVVVPRRHAQPRHRHRLVPRLRHARRRSMRSTSVDPDKIFLVQLSDFMWQEMRTVEERIDDRAALPRVPRRRRAQRAAGRAGAASSTAWAIAATTASRSSTTTTSRCRRRRWRRARGAARCGWPRTCCADRCRCPEPCA